MGILGSVKSNFKKSEAAVIIQKLLEMQAGLGTFVGNPAKSATLIIANAWNNKPDIFNGKFGQRPHKMSAAATAFAIAIEEMSPENPHYLPIIFAFSRLIEDYELNGELYPFSSMDIKLLNSARQTFIQVSNSLGNEV
ncbi:MAG: hypothetical protein K0A92_08405 [Methyloprofundus sp.]|nr:hypothetical protein [Methyloprofundus sp.]